MELSMDGPWGNGGRMASLFMGMPAAVGVRQGRSSGF